MNYIKLNKMKTIKLLTIASLLFFFTACESKTDVVESGTYKGKIDKVEADEREIYVIADGKNLSCISQIQQNLQKMVLKYSLANWQKTKLLKLK